MKLSTKFERPLITNECVTCYSDRLVIHLYYFPYGDKTIKYKDIRSCELSPLRYLNRSKYKTWGMALSPIWWHSDLHRYYRENYMILNTNHWPKIGITMDDNDITNVYKLIKKEIDSNPSVKSPSKRKSFSRPHKIDIDTMNSLAEKGFEYGYSPEDDKGNYTDW